MTNLNNPPLHVASGNFTLNRWSPQRRNLQAWWPFFDSAGLSGLLRERIINAHGETWNGDPTWIVDPEMGNVLDFDGTGDYIDTVDRGFGIGANNFAVAFWMKKSNNDLKEHVIDFRDGNTNGFFISIHDSSNGNEGKVRLFTNDGSNSSIYSATAVDDGNWHHIVCVRNSTAGTIYIDGISDQTGSTQSGDMGTRRFRIAESNDPGGTRYFTGQIADIRFYKGFPSANEIWRMWAPETRWELYVPTVGSALSHVPAVPEVSDPFATPPARIFAGFTINEQSTQSDGLRGWWPMLGVHGVGGALRDRVIGRDATFNGAPTWAYDVRMGVALDFDGASDYLDADDSDYEIGTTDNLAFSVWIKKTTQTTRQFIASWQDTGSDTGVEIYVQGSADTNEGAIKTEIDGAGGSGTLTDTLRIDDDLWHLITYSLVNGTQTLYVDGVSRASGSVAPGDMGSRRLRWGANNAGAEFFDGVMSDLRVYNRGLSSNEAWQMWGASTRWELYKPASYWYMYKVPEISYPERTPPPHVLTGNFATNQDSEQARDLVGWWPLITNPSKARNMVLYGNDGVFVNTPDPIVDRTRGRVLDFNGTNEYITVDDYNALDQTTFLGFSAWVYINAFIGGERDVILAKELTVDVVTQYNWRLSETTMDFIYHDTGATNHSYTATHGMLAGQWYHVAMTYKSATAASAKMWVNGVDIGGSWTTGTGAGALDTDTEQLWIAATEFVSRHWLNGRLSDVRMYGKLLTDNDVWQIFSAETRWELYQIPSQAQGLSVPALPSTPAAALVSRQGSDFSWIDFPTDWWV